MFLSLCSFYISALQWLRRQSSLARCKVTFWRCKANFGQALEGDATVAVATGRLRWTASLQRELDYIHTSSIMDYRSTFGGGQIFRSAKESKFSSVVVKRGVCIYPHVYIIYLTNTEEKDYIHGGGYNPMHSVCIVSPHIYALAQDTWVFSFVLLQTKE